MTANRTAEDLLGALPVPNTLGLFPGSRERSTTVITFLFFHPDAGLDDQVEVARELARREINRPDDALMGVTGAAPARETQERIIREALPLVEAATVALIAVVVGITFRSVGAPLITLSSAGIAFVLATRVVAWAAGRFGLTAPPDLEPVMVALLLGIVTDYAVFYLSGMRTGLAAGLRPVDAARRTTAEVTPIIVTAGLLVAGGSAALLAGRLDFLRAFGPALALTVVVALAVTITLLPALLGILGRRAFWPRRAAAGPEGVPALETDEHPSALRQRFARWASARPAALVIALLTAAVLAVPVLWVPRMHLGFRLVEALPEDTEAERAQDAAERGFAPGVLSPTLVLLEQPGIGDRMPSLQRLEQEIERRRGVAGVVGAGDQAVLERAASSLAGAGFPDVRGVMVTRDGSAARFAVIFDSDPLGGGAIRDLRRMQAEMPTMLRTAGLDGARVRYAGDTALVEETIDLTLRDLGRIALAMLSVDLVLLVIFLRALIAPIFLLAASVLALGTALGITTFFFQNVLGQPDITYYVPFAVAVLLVSLGSDYNVFVVGRIWAEARRRPLREAVTAAAPRASRAITIAGLALAGSFSLLALVPLDQFREFAFAMVVGILIDTFVVRSLLVPALISLFGTAGRWPGRRLRRSLRPEG